MAYRLEVDPDDYRGAAPRSRGRRQLAWAIGTLVAVFCAAGLFAAFRLMTHRLPSGAVPVIHADDRPFKVRPDQPGGMIIPDQDKFILNRERVVDPKVEQLLPPPETPLPRPAPPPAEPTVVETPAPQEPAAAPPPAVPAAAAPAPVAAAAPARPVAAAAPPVRAPAPAGRGYRLQIAALRTPEAAKREWERLQHRERDLLAGLGYTVARIDLGERGVFYRIQAGPIADPAMAERVCGELKKRGVGCILVKP